MAQRVLILRLSSLGDVVLTAPIFKNIKAHWPQARVCLMAKPAFLPALERNPYVDEVIAYRGLRQALRDIRSRDFTHLLDLHGVWRTFCVRTLSRVPNIAVYRKDALARRLYVSFRWSSPHLVKHTLDRYLESLAAWGVPVLHRELSLGDYSDRPEPAKPGARVLIAQTSFLGDTLLTIPLVKRVREALPGCRLSVLTRPQLTDLFRSEPAVDEVIEDDKRARHSGALGLWQLARSLRERSFDVALVPHRSLRSALLVWLARIPLRIGFSSSAGSFFFQRTVHFSWAMPELERNLALLSPLLSDMKPGQSDALFLSRPSAEPIESSVAALLAPLGKEGPLIGLHPGSAWETKRWPWERYARLAERLSRERGARIVLIGGPEDAELARAILGRFPGALNLTGKTTLRELLALARKLDLFVTNDSGPMHVAAASGVPTLALFGPTSRELGFFPYGRGHRVLEKDLTCRPCGLHGSRSCPEGHFLCMRLIEVDEVLRNAAEMLDARSEASCPP